MVVAKVFRGFMVPPLILLLLIGCGSERTTADLDPEGGAKQKQARINAYGKAGVENAKGKAGGAGGGSQGNARRAGR